MLVLFLFFLGKLYLAFHFELYQRVIDFGAISFAQDSRIFREERRWWMTPRKQLLLDTTGLMIYIRTCRDCDNIYKTCTGSNQNPSITSRYKVPFILTRNLFAMDNSGKGINHFFTNEESLVLFSGIVGKIKNTPWFLFVFILLLLCFDILPY